MRKLSKNQTGIKLMFCIMGLAFIAMISACSGLNGNSFIEEEVTFTNPVDGAILSGTLTKPSNKGVFPAVILISGSGLQDRDETVYGHKPFKVLAEYLTKNGIAVLRFDDRGAGKSTGDVWNATIEVFAGDALAGIDFLKSCKNVNPYRIGIIGHSQGAMEGMMLASKYNDIAFLIMLGGPGIPWAENMVEANEENLRRQGKSKESIDAGNKLLKKMIPVMQAGSDYEITKNKLYEVVREWKQSLTGTTKTEIEEFDKSHPGFWKTMASDYATPIYMSAVNFIPSQYLKKIHCPVLSIIGDKDVHVLSSLNNPVIQNALDQGGNKNSTVVELNDINHMLQKCETGLISEYAEIEESFNQEVLELITTWINDQGNVKPSDEILNLYRKQSSFTDPGEYAYLYKDLPESMEEICDLIKKQLIHPMEAGKMRDILPEGRAPEDGDFPIVRDMLNELIQRNENGITMNRKPGDRLIVACYHHALLHASILRSQGKSVRLRGGFARYFEDEMKVRFGHVICEVWNPDKEQWVLIDPDRNYIDISSNKFESPAEAWHNFSNNNSGNVRYISSVGEGAQAIIHALLLDQAFILFNERNYWHTPSFLFTKDFNLNNLRNEQLKVLNQIAKLMIVPEANISKLQKLYDDNPFLHTHVRSIMDYYEMIENK
ncbi:MAG: alpha/beta hydrolase [Bacteroidales bacterium]|nr:alpha/beta hydrolase [Bacteroidales bacterium]